MGSSQQKAVVKRRGRPIANPAEEDEVLQTRRERNREAQHVFRKRRQAAEAAQEKRLRRLEDVVEEMSSVFMRFADDMLAADVVKRNASLVDSLHGSMAKVLALAQEVVEPEDEAAAPELLNESQLPQQAEKGKGKEPARSSAVSEPDPASSSASTLAGSSEDIATSYFPATSSALTMHSNAFIDPTLPELPVDPNLSMSIPPQIFGNGWPGFDPLEYVRRRDQQHDFHPPPLPDDAFVSRLTETAVSMAYLALTGAADPGPPPGTVERMFASTLRFRPRQKIIYKLRWLLGPGRAEMHLVSHLPLAPTPEGGWPIAAHGGTIIDDDSAAAGVYLDERWPGNKFLSAVGVYQYLQGFGARMVAPDTMEIDIVNPHPASSPTELPYHARLSPATDSGPSSSHQNQQQQQQERSMQDQSTQEQQPDSWSFVNFYPEVRSAGPSAVPATSPSMMTMRLNVSLLIQNLVQLAVCMARGPGFQRNGLGKAIEASVIGVQTGIGVY